MILELERRLMFYFWRALRFVRELLIVNIQILRFIL